MTVNGLVPHRNRRANAYQIGVVYGQRSQLWRDLPLIDSFDALRGMYRIDKAQFNRRSAFLVELFDMDEFLKQPVRKLSLGQPRHGNF